jgi:hypothetical protein
MARETILEVLAEKLDAEDLARLARGGAYVA